MSQIIKAPERKGWVGFSIFLAGSIEMGTVEDWHTQVEMWLRNYNVTILNPRRDDWDSSWVQCISNPQFREQVEWELDMMEAADIVAMYLAPGTMSPISLLELGNLAWSSKLVVCCPEGFERKGNVDIVCYRNGIALFNDKLDWLEYLEKIAIKR
jgi:hypothetical protein